ncbi:MAG: hypothetical protein KIS77_01175 [Saprospiraceae bacterium]|nr:hypothetical protein [Saprospiraceae bacterium]
MTLIDQIRDLIAEGETQRSLDELYKYVKESNADVIDNLVMLRGRMQDLQRSINNGTMDNQTAALERAKINEAILKMLPQLTPEYLAEASKRKEPLQRAVPAAAPAVARSAEAPARDMKKWYLIGGGALLVVVLLISTLGGGDTSEDFQEQTVAESTDATFPNAPSENAAQQNFQQQPSQAEQDHLEWQSNNGAVSFVTQNGTNWNELDGGGAVRFKFKLTEETEEYVEIYDASRGTTLRIYNDKVQFQQGDNTEWRLLAYGGWK